MSSTFADELSEKSKDGVLFKRPGCKYTRFGLKRPHSTRQRVGRHVLVTCLTNTSNLASLNPSSPANLFTLQIQIQKSPKTGLRHMSYWSQRQTLASLSSSTCPCLKCKCQHKKMPGHIKIILIILITMTVWRFAQEWWAEKAGLAQELLAKLLF